MNTPQPTTSPHPDTSALPSTLEELQQRKAKLLQEIGTQKTLMSCIGCEIAAPFAPAASKGNSVLRAFNRGMAVFDGVMLGLKVMRKFKSIFGKKRRYRY